MELSDVRLKENIRPIENAGALLDLNPVCFNMIGSKKKQYGFIAQEVEETALESIVYQNDRGVRSLQYSQLIAILVEHVKQLTKKVAALEARQNKLAYS